MNQKQQKWFLGLGVVMLGAVMRAPFTAVPAILTDIANDLHVPIGSLGLLTSVPVLMFALCSSWAPRLASRFGQERVLGAVLFLMAAGSILRVVNVPALYVGTLLLGVGIAFINVLLPSFIAAHFPEKVGWYTTVYVGVMGISVSLASLLAAPIAAASSWQFLLVLLTGVVLLAALLWLPNLSYQPLAQAVEVSTDRVTLWKNKGAWIFLLFAGVQSIVYYTEIAWLPTLAQSAGLGNNEAGMIASIFSLVGIPVSMVIPTVLFRLKAQQRALMMTGLSFLSLVGFGILLTMPSDLTLWLAASLLLGIPAGALFPYMMLSFSMKTTSPQAAAQLAGMVQSGAFLMAAVGPSLLGFSYEWTQSWQLLLAACLVLTLIMMGSILLIEKQENIL